MEKGVLNLKKSALAVLAFASTTVFSGTMGSVCTPGNATVPCEQSAWSFGAEALYLQASMGTFIFPNYTIIANNVQDFQNPKNLWGWGFMVEGAYHFNAGNDLNLNWNVIERNKLRYVAFSRPEKTCTVLTTKIDF